MIENGAAQFIMPDICWCGGISEARKIAPWAETYNLTRWGFREVIENGAAQFIMPDICWCGGISEARKIAPWAETYNPHRPA